MNNYKIIINNGALYREQQGDKIINIIGKEEDVIKILEEEFVDIYFLENYNGDNPLEYFIYNYINYYDPSGSTIVKKIFKDNKLIFFLKN